MIQYKCTDCNCYYCKKFMDAGSYGVFFDGGERIWIEKTTIMYRN